MLRIVKRHQGFLWVLALIVVILAPVLASPQLRASILGGLPTLEELRIWLLSEGASRFMIEVLTFLVVAAAVLVLAELLWWLNFYVGSELERRRRCFYIISALGLFLMLSILWVWGVVVFGQLDLSALPGVEALIWVVVLAILGIFALCLFRPAIWAAKMLLRGRGS